MKIKMKRKKEKMKEKYNKGKKESNYNIRDLVWLDSWDLKMGQTTRWLRNEWGHIILVTTNNPIVVEIRNVCVKLYEWKEC